MRRRGFLLALLAAPLLCNARAPRRVGIVHGSASFFSAGHPVRAEFLAAMKELGYREGRDCEFDFREWKRLEEIPGAARELVKLGSAVIVASGPPSILGVRSVTDRVPIVMVGAAEPVATGLVKSLSRPGGNVTGLTWDHGFESAVKQVEIMREALPKMGRIALLWDASDKVHPIYARYYDKAAKQVGLEFVSVDVRAPSDFAASFEKMVAARIEALIVIPSAQLTLPHRGAILSEVVKRRIPTITGPVYLDHPGALFIWGPSQTHVPRRTAAFVDRVLKGANPAELPIEQPDRYLLHVDMRVARTLGVTVPQSILLQAERVIE
jgi:putative ABC transport system substrate-binding protein